LSQVFWSLLWFAFLVAWIGGAIAAMVHLVRRVRAPAWVLVPMGVALFVLPLVTVALYWLVIAILRPGRPGRPERPAHAPMGDAPAWPPPAPDSRGV